MQPVGERLFDLRSAIGICPSQTWLGFVLALEKFYALVATVKGSPMIEGVRSGAMVRVGMAMYVERLEVI